MSQEVSFVGWISWRKYLELRDLILKYGKMMTSGVGSSDERVALRLTRFKSQPKEEEEEE